MNRLPKILIYLASLATLLLISSCGKISIDGYSTYSLDAGFGDVRTTLNGTKSGVLFIHRKAPFDLMLSFAFHLEELKMAKIRNLELRNANSKDVLFALDEIELSTSPKPGESRVYFNKESVLQKYEDVELEFTLELVVAGEVQSHAIKCLLEKTPSTRWWSFFELV